MKRMKIEDAVGKPLAHDIINYGPKAKEVLFKRGHVISTEDLDDLKNNGNYQVYVESEKREKSIHEEEAALRIARAAAGENISIRAPRKGRVRLTAETPGLLKVDAGVITNFNLLDDFVLATKKNNIGVETGKEVGSTKIIPLTIERGRLKTAEKILEEGEPAIKVIPPQIEKIGVIITGDEIYKGRIDDAFEPTLKKKLEPFSLTIAKTSILPDNKEKIKKKILEYREEEFELIIVTGGMAVDAGDLTAEAIKETGAKLLPRGIPIFPGNMAVIAYINEVPLLGVPACVLPDKHTSFDFLLPQVLADEKITNKDIAELGHGGLL